MEALTAADGAGGNRGGLLPTAKYKDFTPPPKTIARTSGHYQEWIAAAKGGPPANCNFEFATLINETALLGVISTRTGKHLLWDKNHRRGRDGRYRPPPAQTRTCGNYCIRFLPWM